MINKNALLAIFLLPVFYFFRHYHGSWLLMGNPQVLVYLAFIYTGSIIGYQIILHLGVTALKSSLIVFLVGLSFFCLEPLQAMLQELTHNNPIAGFDFLIPGWIIVNGLLIKKMLHAKSPHFRSAWLLNVGLIILVIAELFFSIRSNNETKRNNIAESNRPSLGILTDLKKDRPRCLKLTGAGI